MAAPSAAVVRNSRVRSKTALFALLALGFLFVLWNNERFLVFHSHPDWTYYFPVRWWLIPHGLGGLTVLLLGPFQLSSRFRERHLRLHRIMGRFYMGAMLVATSGAMYIGYVHTRPPVALFTFVLAFILLLFVGLAFISIRNGNVQQHRQWMTRSYALMTIFVSSRVIEAIPAIGRLDEDGSARVLWTLMVATMVLTELGLAWHGIFTNRRKQRVPIPDRA